MANIASARKRARTSEKSRQRNVAMRSKFRTHLKNIIKAIDAGNKEEATKLYQNSISVIDSTAQKGLIHANKAARHKQRLNARIRAMA